MSSEFIIKKKSMVITIVFILVFIGIAYYLYKKSFNITLDSETEKFSEKSIDIKTVSQTDCPDSELQYKQNKFSFSTNQDNYLSANIKIKDSSSSTTETPPVLNNPILKTYTQAPVNFENEKKSSPQMVEQQGSYSTTGEYK